MTKKKAPKKAPKRAKEVKDQPPERTGMDAAFDDAMTRIAQAPWPPPKK